MKKRALQIAVIGGLVVAAFVFRGSDRTSVTPESSETAETSDAAKAAVFDSFDAAERGDADAYLRLTAGQLRKSLQQTQSQLGTEAFAESLRRSAIGIKGIAATRSDDAPPGLMALDVEIVFADRNERQRMLLAPKGNGWVITSIDGARMVKPSIPYGTPVFEEPGQEGAQGEPPTSPAPGGAP